MTFISLLLLCLSLLASSTLGFIPQRSAAAATILTSRIATATPTTALSSLKPAAIPLMDSGKALARSGELLIDLTAKMDLYGGALSSSGALIRTAGDCVAQAAALCRFKTGAELACDELREGATCLTEAVEKLRQAVEEAETDKDDALAQNLGAYMFYVVAATSLLYCTVLLKSD
jgi:hypothetical protein